MEANSFLTLSIIYSCSQPFRNYLPVKEYTSDKYSQVKLQYYIHFGIITDELTSRLPSFVSSSKLKYPLFFR